MIFVIDEKGIAIKPASEDAWLLVQQSELYQRFKALRNLDSPGLKGEILYLANKIDDLQQHIIEGNRDFYRLYI